MSVFERSWNLKSFVSRSLIAAAMCACVGIQALSAAGPEEGGGHGADVAAARADVNSKLAHQQLLEKAKAGKGTIGIYFEGDSIFRRWGTSDAAYARYMANWRENFFGWNAADFGWGADRVENILWRLQNGELDDVNPKVVVFLGGTNNLNAGAGVEANAADITKGLMACFDAIHNKAPDSILIIVGILPRLPAADNPIVAKINDNLAKLADGKKVRFINVNDRFLDKDGKLAPGMLNSDHLHPNTEGYQAIADALKPILTEILGAPAKEDHAPPATGDPSAAPRQN